MERKHMTSYKQILKLLNARKVELETIIETKKIELKNAPEGELRTAKCRNKIQYFKREKGGDSNGEYIKYSDIDLARRLAQKEYDNYAIQAAEKEVKLLDSMKRLYEGRAIEHIGLKMVKAKMALVTPVEKSDEDYVEEWLAQEYELFDYYSEALTYENSKGIKMRSKSEVLISNILDELGIPYLYEKPLKLSKYKTVSPDFTLLDMRTRQEVYLEHLGMLDNMDYVEKNMNKIRAYEEAGIYIGSRLLISHEARNAQFNAKSVKGMLSEYFNKSV